MFNPILFNSGRDRFHAPKAERMFEPIETDTNMYPSCDKCGSSTCSNNPRIRLCDKCRPKESAKSNNTRCVICNCTLDHPFDNRCDDCIRRKVKYSEPAKVETPAQAVKYWRCVWKTPNGHDDVGSVWERKQCEYSLNNPHWRFIPWVPQPEDRIIADGVEYTVHTKFETCDGVYVKNEHGSISSEHCFLPSDITPVLGKPFPWREKEER